MASSGSTLLSGGIENVFLSGLARGTIVESGGKQQVLSGGSASGTTVSSGGRQYVYSGGTASDTTVSSGGLQDVKPGGYELRVRTVDKNGFAQPEPRPYPKSGRKEIQYRPLVVMG